MEHRRVTLCLSATGSDGKLFNVGHGLVVRHTCAASQRVLTIGSTSSSQRIAYRSTGRNLEQLQAPPQVSLGQALRLSWQRARWPSKTQRDWQSCLALCAPELLRF